MMRRAVVVLLLGLVGPARAVDGCLVLLCFAAPSWRSIPQCVSPIQQVLNDLSHGHSFPSCDMSGAGTGASNEPAFAPSHCPPQYTTQSSHSQTYFCSYTGAISVEVDGAFWSRTWWNTSGDSVTEYSDVAKAQLGTWDTRFDDDYAVWLVANQPAPCTEDC
jgi:hypothetical protein